MHSPGYIYVIINQSIPGHVKIGKTTREPSIRAVELSAATGVATPFLVAYEAYFEDCDYAENYIHTILERHDVILAKNREFFTISATEAINIVIQAQEVINQKSSNQVNNSYSNEVQETNVTILANVGCDPSDQYDEFLEDAYAYWTGWGDKIIDVNKAIKLFKSAAKLGSDDAYIQLGNIHAESGDFKQGLSWIVTGAEKGFPECWIELYEIFVGANTHFGESVKNHENAVKSYRQFFSAISKAPASFDTEGSRLFIHLMRFCCLLKDKIEKRDAEIIKDFLAGFRLMLISLSDKSDSQAKLKELDIFLLDNGFWNPLGGTT
ncbi:MAG: hypothetical protein CMK02_04820 [Polycyclovorans sp.]|nr:hypothetical protein [Polycyclovorans sp.]|tara:strand:- start:216 stop:1184 length:969 start_codon:yes stop_codon:yes gene_type:complete